MKIILKKLPKCFICKKAYRPDKDNHGFHTNKMGAIENCKYILPSQIISKFYDYPLQTKDKE